MKRFASVFLALSIPLTALALDFTDLSSQYKDAPFSKPEAAGISLLTSLGVVAGNPDGTFAANRTLNRAEFTKIALKSLNDSMPVAQSCFPDVNRVDWFSPYVCEAKKRGVLQGYPDGSFRPDQPVNYAEALKILTNLYKYDVVSNGTEEWYVQYVRAARNRGTLLPTSVEYPDFLTRGDMARLTAGFIAESKGQLVEYRRVEQGQSASTSSSSSSSSSSSVSSQASQSSSSSSSSSVKLPDFPSKNRLLLLGSTRTEPLIGQGIMVRLEDILVTEARVKLRDEIKSFDTLFLIDEKGVTVGELSLDATDNAKKTWRGVFATASGSAYRLPKNTNRVFGIVARLKAFDNGGISGEHIRFDTFTITGVGVDSNTTYDSPTPDFTFPEHDTVMGKITRVWNVGDQNGALTQGQGRILGSFSAEGVAVQGTTLFIRNLVFTVSKSSDVAIQNWKLRATDTNTTLDCTVNGTLVSCSALPSALGVITSPARTFQITADVAVDAAATQPYVQVSLYAAGDNATAGAVQWTDGAASFSWIEQQSPLAQGTLWK